MAQRPRAMLQLSRLEDRVNPVQFAANQALVAFNPGAEQAALAAVNNTAGVVETKAIGFGLYQVRFQASVPTPQAVSTLSGVPGVKFAEPNYIVQRSAFPNDPSFQDGTLWAHLNTGQNGGTAGADARSVTGWDIGVGTGDTIVAVIDDGVQHTHPDLMANMWTNPGEVPGDGIDNDGNGFVDDVHGYDFSRNTGDILGGISNDHGTHVAGTIGAVGNNGIGVTGMAWKTRIMTVPLFSSGANSGQISVAIQALNYAVMMGSKLSNNSWGYQGPASAALQTAIAAANTANHVFVAAAANSSLDNDTNGFFPTNFYGVLPNVVSVAAFDRNDQLAGFSNYGRQSVMLGAPGVAIYSTSTGSGYAFKQGTSMASPQVAGALAVFMDATPGATAAQVVNALRLSVRQIPAANGKTDTGGVLDLNQLMQLSGASVYVTGADAGGGPHVKVFRGRGLLVNEFMAYDPAFTGGVRVATGDVTGDRFADIVTVAGPGGGPHVKVFDGKTFQEVYSFFAFEPGFSGGLTVSTGDVNGDGRADIIVGADAGGGPRVAVFSRNAAGGLVRIADFFAYDINFRGGVRVAAGAFTPGSKMADVITTPGAGGGPHLRRFSAASVAAGNPLVASETMVGDPNSNVGLFVAAGDFNGDGIADITTGAASGTPIVTLLNGLDFSVLATIRNPFTGELPGLTNPNSPTSIGSPVPPFLNNGLLPPGASPDSLPYLARTVKPGELAGYIYGVRVAVQDVTGDKIPDMILGGGPNDIPVITLMDGKSLGILGTYFAYDPGFFGGVYVGGVGA